MSNSQLENVFKLLRNNKLQFELKLSDNLKCVICKGILINAHHGVCGCRFCLECICNYLNGEERFCPGEMDGCTKHNLDLQTNIQTDYETNKIISNLKVKCPSQSCELVLGLKNLEEHIAEHLIKCPYSNLGCLHTDDGVIAIKDHLRSDSYAHTVMMTECLDNLKSKFASLSENANEKNLIHLEIQDVMKYVRETEAIKFGEIDRLKVMLDHCLIENLQLNGEVQNAQRGISSLKEESRRIQGQVTDLQRDNIFKNDKYDVDGTVIEKDITSHEDKHGKSSEKMKVRKNEVKTISSNLLWKKKLIVKLEKRLEEVMLIYRKIQKLPTQESRKKGDNEIEHNVDISKKNMLRTFLQELKKLHAPDEINQMLIEIIDNSIGANIGRTAPPNPSVGHPSNNDIVPFDWRIENFSKKWKSAQKDVDPYIMSGAFYSHGNGYKLILGVYPDGFDTDRGSFLSVFFHIAKGEHDDKLSWPMRQELFISLIDQDTGCPHTTERFKYDTAEKSVLPSYYKPKSAINLGYGATKFIDLLELFKSKQLFKGDAIIIRCSIDIA